MKRLALLLSSLSLGLLPLLAVPTANAAFGPPTLPPGGNTSTSGAGTGASAGASAGSAGSTSSGSTPASNSGTLFDNAKNQACQGLAVSDNANQNSCDEKAGSTANSLLKTGINLFSIVIGIIAVIMVIVGGLKYITSSGDSNNVNSAKNTILYALIGLVIVALAQVIVRFVLHKAAPTTIQPVKLFMAPPRQT